jgi:hypothetical protein
METVPNEIWEKIISYATGTSLLPFTESGEIAPSLVDTIDLFLTRCSTFQKYHYETLTTVRCLRSVCRTWAAILRGTGNGIAYANRLGYVLSYHHLFGGIMSLWVGSMSESCSCTSRLKEQGLCLYTQLQSQQIRASISKFDENFLTQFCSGHLKILYWRSSSPQPPVFPMKLLGNLMALSLNPGDVSPPFSLKDLFSSAPHLSHFHLSITDSSAHLLSETAECLSLTHLRAEITFLGAHKEPGFVWSFPRLRTFVLWGMIRKEHQADVEGFLSRHTNSIVEFEVIDLHYISPSFPLPLNLITPSLWEICPNIRVIGLSKRMIDALGTSKIDWETHSTYIPPLTFIILAGYYLLLHDDFVTLSFLKKRLNVEKVVVAEPWEQLHRQGCLRFKDVRVETRSSIELLLERLTEKDISLFDKYGTPLTHFLRDLSTRLES